DVAVAPAVVAAGVLEGVGDAAVHARDLLEEAVEEDGVARLVHLLGGEEILLLLARGRLDVGREVVGDRVLAVEEHRVGPERRAPLDVGERLPALAVLGEVERGGAPVRLLPALVEVLVADRLDAHARSIANRPRRRAKPVRARTPCAGDAARPRPAGHRRARHLQARRRRATRRSARLPPPRGAFPPLLAAELRRGPGLRQLREQKLAQLARWHAVLGERVA